MCFRLQQGMPSYQSPIRLHKGIGTERRKMQSVSMHAGLCNADYCLVSVEKRAQRLYGHVARKQHSAQTLSSLVVD